MSVIDLVFGWIEEEHLVQCSYQHHPANFTGHPDTWHPDESELDFSFIGYHSILVIPWSAIDLELDPIEAWVGKYTHVEGRLTYIADLSVRVVKIGLQGVVGAVEIGDVSVYK